MRGLGWEAVTWALAGLAALGAVALHVPLAVVVGPLVAMVFLGRAQPRLRISPPVRLLAVAGLGVFLGEKIDLATFDPGLGGLVIVVNTLLITATVIASTLVLHRLYGHSPRTAWLSSLAGGFFAVMEAARRHSGTDRAAVIFLQVERMVIGASMLPWGFWLAGFDVPPLVPTGAAPEGVNSLFDIGLLAVAAVGGALLGRRLHFPGAEITVPILVSVALNGSGLVAVAMPMELVAGCYALAGASVGLQLPRPALRQTLIWGAQGLTVMVLAVGLALATAHLMAPLFHTTAGVAFLIIAPASTTETTAMALVLGQDPALVTLGNVWRVLFTSMLVGLTARLRG